MEFHSEDLDLGHLNLEVLVRLSENKTIWQEDGVLRADMGSRDVV